MVLVDAVNPSPHGTTWGLGGQFFVLISFGLPLYFCLKMHLRNTLSDVRCTVKPYFCPTNLQFDKTVRIFWEAIILYHCEDIFRFTLSGTFFI